MKRLYKVAMVMAMAGLLLLLAVIGAAAGRYFWKRHRRQTQPREPEKKP